MEIADVGEHQAFYLTHHVRGHAFVCCQADGIQPELALQVSCRDMDVGWLAGFVGVEVKPVRTYSQYGWHCFAPLRQKHSCMPNHDASIVGLR